MNKLKTNVFTTLILSLLSLNEMNAQGNMNQSLDAKQQSIVTISAFTAKGDVTQLKTALNNGLNAGLTINEIKEELVQLYAYCGFPRSLNAINTFLSVLEERKTKGINDVIGKETTPITDTADKYTTGKKVLEILTGKTEAEPKTGFAAFAPIIDTFLKEHLFADIFSRDVLSYQQRELVTISTLATLAGVESQLQAHIGMGMNIGITEAQLTQMLSIIEINIGKKEAETGKEVLTKVIAARQ